MENNPRKYTLLQFSRIESEIGAITDGIFTNFNKGCSYC
jgi:hypothetical protein